MTLLETLIFTQIGSVGARDVPFSLRDYFVHHYIHNRYAKYQTVNKGLERDACGTEEVRQHHVNQIIAHFLHRDLHTILRSLICTNHK